jgi:hypothetical protein
MARAVNSAALALVMALTLAGSVVAQSTTITSSDIERLQFAVDDARNDVAQLRSRNASEADRLQAMLDDLADEVIYLKVRLRKERSVPRTEYTDVRDRIEDISNEARSRDSSQRIDSRYPESNRSTTTTPRRGGPNEIPVGQELDVRLQTALNSGTAQVEDRVEATTLADLFQDERVLVPAGSVVRGTVTSVDSASRTDRKGSLTVVFDQLTVNGRQYPIRATVAQALESEGIRGETGRIATGAGVGAIIGGILGGFKGAIAGILIGGGGTVMATEGKDVDLPTGTVLRIRFDSPVTIR